MTDKKTVWAHVNDVAKNLEAQLRPVRRLATENRDCIDANAGELDRMKGNMQHERAALDRLAERVEVLEAELANRGILSPWWRALRKAAKR